MTSFMEKVKDQGKGIGVILNSTLVCKDCVFRNPDDGKAAMCEKYFPKPVEVLDGGACRMYKKEEKHEE